MQDLTLSAANDRADQFSFLRGGGEMITLTRQFNWSQTSLGNPADWPQSLKTTLSIILHSKSPMFLFWGEELICFYNDAYRPSLGNDGKHPGALGQPAKTVWPEIWDFIGPIIDNVLAGGEASWNEDQLLPIFRNNEMEDVYWTFSYSPVNDESGRPAGVFVACAETTEKVLNLRRLESSKDELFFAVESNELGTWDLNPATNLFKGNTRLKNWFGLQPYEDIQLELATSVIKEQDRPAVIAAISNALSFESGGRYDINYSIIHPVTKEERIVRAIGRAWFNDDRIAYRFNGTLQDITLEARAREQLMESERKFRNIVEHAPVATCLLVGQNMLIEVANDLMISYWGKDMSVIGQNLIDAIPELNGQPYLEILNNVYTTGVAYSASDARVILNVTGTPQEYYFDFTYKPLFDQNGNTYAIMNMAVDVTDRFLARQKIEEVQLELLASFEQAPVAIAIISKDDLVFRMANSFYGYLVGRPTSALLNKPLLTALPELAGQGFDILLHNVMDTGVPYIAHEVEVEVKKDGKLQTIYVDLTYKPRRESGNVITGVLVVAIDVTIQVISRKKIENSEARFRSLIAEAPIPTCLFVGPDMIVELANEAMLNTWNKGTDVLGKPHREILPELAGQRLFEILDEVYNSGKAYEAKASQVFLEHDGVLSVHYFSFTYKPLFNNEGNVYAIIAMAIDVTEEVIGWQKIEKAEASLRGAVELAELSTWSLDIKQNIITYSPRFMEWLGLTADTQPLKEVFKPLPDDLRLPVLAAIAEATTNTSTGLYENEHPVINTVTGQERIIHAQAQLFYDTAGEPAYLSGTAQDITAQRKLQQQLETQVAERTAELAGKAAELADLNRVLLQTNAELNEFAYVASHDLQEPLRKVRTFTELMEGTLETIPDKTRMYLDKIQASTKRMQALINDVLKFSLLSQERQNFEKVDLNTIIQHILADYELLIEQKQATVTVNRLPSIEAVPLQMSQLFTNLISNALKFTSPERPLTIDISCKNVDADAVSRFGDLDKTKTYQQLVFRDNGIGFNQEYAIQIFNIFQRLHSKSEFEGTGIGLALCKKIISNHHGVIYANSKKNEGATFNIILPVSQR